MKNNQTTKEDNHYKEILNHIQTIINISKTTTLRPDELPRPGDNYEESKSTYDDLPNDIEKILIEIYDFHIYQNNQAPKKYNVKETKEKIATLVKENEYEFSINIMQYLLTKIKELIHRYKKKLFCISNIRNLRELYYTSRIRGTKSPKNNLRTGIISIRGRYKSKFNLPSLSCTHRYVLNSIPQHKEQFKYLTIRKIFSELRNIKVSLTKSAKEVEEMFKAAKKRFSNFSIDLCQREDFCCTWINDKFINYWIEENTIEEFDEIIKEITEDSTKNITEMSDFLALIERYKEYSDEENSISLNTRILNEITRVNMGMKQKRDEEIKQDLSNKKDIDELVKYIVTDDKKKVKKKKKKGKGAKKESTREVNNIRWIHNLVDEWEGDSDRDNNCIDKEIENYILNINKISKYSYKTQKIQSKVSKDWLNKLSKELINTMQI